MALVPEDDKDMRYRYHQILVWGNRQPWLIIRRILWIVTAGGCTVTLSHCVPEKCTVDCFSTMWIQRLRRCMVQTSTVCICACALSTCAGWAMFLLYILARDVVMVQTPNLHMCIHMRRLGNVPFVHTSQRVSTFATRLSMSGHCSSNRTFIVHEKQRDN